MGDSKSGDSILKEFSKPLLQKSKQQIVKSPHKSSKKSKNNKNNNNYNDNNNFVITLNTGLRSNASTYSIIPISEVTSGAVEVWANLPDEIRQDPSFKSFRQEHERIYGK